MRRILLLTTALLCAAITYADRFKVIVPLSPEMDGAMAILRDYDTGAPIDSARIEDHAARFEGDIDEPAVAVVSVPNDGRYIFILEPGTISFTHTGLPFGSMLNDQLRELCGSIERLDKKSSLYRERVNDCARDNADNILGQRLSDILAEMQIEPRLQ